MALPRLLWVWLLVAGTQGVRDGDMRLANGDAPNEGRVEIFYGGQWGTVCDNLWDLVDASVVCRALGFENATEALGRAAFGPGTGPIMLDEVQCSGTESSLANCSSLGWLRSKCRHNQDAGVICSNETGGAHTLDLSGALPAAQLRGLNLSQDAYQPRLYTSPTWSWAVARSSRESSRRSYDSYPYRYGSYPNQYDSYGRYGPTSAPTGYFKTPQHPSFLFRTSRVSWTLAYLPTVQSCWNYGFSCSSDEMPVLGLSKSGSSDPTIGYENKALMLCGGRFVADVTAFEGGKAEIPSALNANSSRRASFFPCPAGSFSSFRGVIRPFYLTNSSGVD
uniref:Galectin 3 binding protein n=1 Tax=Myotis myotis TaxID=51298 RepID=A0A7J7T5Z8_MYOMY|nr:galectin 3 binding protein [Myotis myotis]